MRYLNVSFCEQLWNVNGVEKLIFLESFYVSLLLRLTTDLKRHFQVENTPLPFVGIDHIRHEAAVVVQNCRRHRRWAKLAILEWALALSTLALPAYVVLHLFETLSSCKTRAATYNSGVALPVVDEAMEHGYVHLSIQNMSTVDVLQIFINVAKAMQRKMNGLEK